MVEKQKIPKISSKKNIFFIPFKNDTQAFDINPQNWNKRSACGRRERKIMKMEENAFAIDIHTNVYKMIKCRYAKGRHWASVSDDEKKYEDEKQQKEKNERREKSSLILIDAKLSTAWIFIYIWYCFERYSLL